MRASAELPLVIYPVFGESDHSSSSKKRRELLIDPCDARPVNEYEQSREALEARFWRRRNELAAVAREQRQRVLAQRDLADATGIRNLVQLRDLMNAGMTPDTVAALAVVPLVVVAWASGSVHPRERAVAHAAAVAAGIPEESEAFEMYTSWLDEKPDLDLLEIWGTYVRALRPRISISTYDELSSCLLARARKIAEAAGGPDDRGAIIAEEAAALEKIATLLA